MKATLSQRFGLLLLALLFASPAFAQPSKTATLAQQLTAALDAAKLQSVAAKDPSGENRFVGCLYIQGLQLLVVSGAYQAPSLLDARLAKGEYREIYIELNGATDPKTRVRITDLGADGLQPDRDGEQPADSYESAGRRVTFDSAWDVQSMSQEEYNKIYAEADQRYAEMLTAMLGQLK
jgi:hypothetical protein